MNLPRTHKVTPENGPRPAGAPDECVYCRKPLGDDHDAACVLRVRTVVVRARIEYVVRVPEQWTREDIEFHRNESSWCANNGAREIAKLAARGCICADTTYDYVREATEGDHDRCGDDAE